MPDRRSLLAGVALAIASGASPGRAAGMDAAVAAALAAGGVAILIRHAAAPGNGDPRGFRLGDCATQRNLSAGGREQAAALGRRLAEAGARIVEARSSRWCRAQDTARLAFPGLAVQPDPALDSFFDASRDGPARTEAARALIAAWRGRPGILALVTHQVNITALTGLSPAEGELVVTRPGPDGIELLGRIRA